MKFENKCVIFDFDGVICDTESINYEANQMAFRDTGLSFSREEYRQLWIVDGLDLPDIVRRYGLRVDPEEIRNRKNLDFKKRIAGGAGIISDEVRNAVASLIGRKWKTAIGSSNSEENILLLLDKSDMKRQFDTIVGLESVKKVKPEPDIFLECLKRTNVYAENAVVVEDAPKGIVAARRAGIGRVIAIPNSWTKDCDFSEADLILDSTKYLPDYIS